MDFELITNELRKRKITQKKMCEDIGFDNAFFSNIKSGDKKVNIELVLKVAKFLNIHPAVLSPEHEEYFPEMLLEAYKKEDKPDNINIDMNEVNNSDNESVKKLKNHVENLYAENSRLKDSLLKEKDEISKLKDLLLNEKDEISKLKDLLLNEKDARIQMYMSLKKIG